MDIAVVLPVTTRASEGLIKHINCLLKEWTDSGADITVTMYLPEGLNILSGSYRVNIKRFPSNDYWFKFKRLSKLVAQGNHDAALVLIARQVALGSLPVVTMVQNVEPIQRVDYAISQKWRLRLWVLRREHRAACQRATRVLVTTQHVKQCLEDLGVASGKIDVIPFGIYPAEVASAGTPPPSISNLAPGSFIFTAGSMVPYRGMDDLVLAYGSLHRRGVTAPLLVIAGEDQTAYGRNIKALAERHDISSCFRWLGRVSREEMAWCYKQCRAFVLTTRAESFCNIALEAMGHGCACIICDHDPMPEVCGEVPLYYRWGDAEALADRLLQITTAGEDELARMIERGRARSARFSWPEVAVDTLKVLKKAIHHES